MEKPTVAITIRNFHPPDSAMNNLLLHCRLVYTNTSGRRLSETDLITAVEGADIAIAGTEPFTRKVIESALRLRIISRVGTGTDSIDVEAVRKRGMILFTTPDAPVPAVAEHTLALILAVTKRIPAYNEGMRTGDISFPPGRLLSGLQAGIIGLGRIGSRVAMILESLGCSIFYYDPFVSPGTGTSWKRAESLQDLAGVVDILTLHTPPQPENRPILTGAVFAACRRGIIIINTARGSLIDEEAMLSSLKDGTVAGAGLDVLSSDPYDGPLLSLPQVILTPHVASYTVETRAMMETEAVRQVTEAINGGRI